MAGPRPYAKFCCHVKQNFQSVLIVQPDVPETRTKWRAQEEWGRVNRGINCQLETLGLGPLGRHFG